MSYNGSGTFSINSAGQPVITGTVISSTAFNALTADLATGLSTAITKDGQTTTTARILFAQGVSSTLVTDATSSTTGSIISAGGISMQKALWVGTTSRHVGATQFDAAITYGGVTLSNAVTGTGNMVLSASATITGTWNTQNVQPSADATHNIGGASNRYAGAFASYLSDGAQAGAEYIGTTASTIRVANGANWTGINLTKAISYGGVTLSNAVTGTGNMVLSASPTLTGTLTAAAATFSSDATFAGNGIKFTGSGSAQATPGIYYQSGTTLFSVPGTGGFAWVNSTNTTALAYLTNAGLLGIGMTPSNVLDITKNQNAASSIKLLNSNGSSGAYSELILTNGTSNANIFQFGTGYGTYSVYRQNGAMLQSDGAGGLTLHAAGANAIYFGQNGNESARFGTDGSFLVGTTTNAGAGRVACIGITNSGTNVFFGSGATATGNYNVLIGNGSVPSSSASNYEIVIGSTNSSTTGKGSSTGFIAAGGAGSIYNGANTTTWATTSDQRLKKNIVDNTDGLAKIMGIRVRNFEYRLPEEVDPELKSSDAILIPGVQLGVIAQELQGILPDCVKQESTGVLSVASDTLTWHLINAIQELTTRLAALENK